MNPTGLGDVGVSISVSAAFPPFSAPVCRLVSHGRGRTGDSCGLQIAPPAVLVEKPWIFRSGMLLALSSTIISGCADGLKGMSREVKLRSEGPVGNKGDDERHPVLGTPRRVSESGDG